MLDEVRPDLVSIATPVYLHHPMMLAALERGAHVLCEKPTALHRFQAAEMHDAAAVRGRVAAHQPRVPILSRAPACRSSCMRRGAIGTPRRGEILGRYAIWLGPSPAA